MEDNLKLSKKNKEFFKSLLQKQKISSVKAVLLLTITKDGDVFLQEKEKTYKKLNVEMSA